MKLNIDTLKSKGSLALTVIGGIAVLKTIYSIVQKVRSKSDDSNEFDLSEDTAPRKKRPLFETAASRIQKDAGMKFRGMDQMDSCAGCDMDSSARCESGR